MTRRPPSRSANPHTIAARTGVDSDTAHGAVMPPLYLSSNYSFAGFEQKRKYDYCLLYTSDAADVYSV